MHRFALLALLVGSMALLNGCESMQKVLAGMDKPTASVKDVRFASLSLSQVGMVFDVQVSNPYSVALPLTEISYGLATQGAAIASGNAALEGTVPARGARTISLPVNLSIAELLNAGSGIQPGQIVPYQADLGMTVNAAGVGPMTLPLSRKGELPIPAVPKMALESVAFETLTLSQATAVLKLDIENTNQFPVDLSKLAYSLSLGGTPVVSSSLTEQGAFKSGQRRRLEIPVRFEPSKLGMAALNMLRGSGGSFELTGDLQLDTRFGAISMPYNQSGTTRFDR